jgi:alkylation response protein AidB-like acyl-CoA dehydrogenase
MRLTDSRDEAAWRTTVRDFLEDAVPSEIRAQAEHALARGAILNFEPDEEDAPENPAALHGGEGFHEEAPAVAALRKKLLANGWIAPSWPRQYGGAGLDAMQQFILNEEFARLGILPFRIPHSGPTIIAHGIEEQKRRLLPPMLTGEQTWCQGFSEPGSGSDLASLQTRAARDGDEFVLNGSKIWTSRAHFSNMMFMLARTDPAAPKHRGITYFVLDMRSPGITIHPLVQMSGAAGFNQVFFEDVRVPAGNVIGEVNRGWYVATTTLDVERSGIGSAIGTTQRVESVIRWAKDHAESGECALRTNPAVRFELADRLIDANVAVMLSYRVVHLQNAGIVPNYEASVSKLFVSELNQRISRTALKVIGPYGVTMDPKSPRSPNGGFWARHYLAQTARTIGGGTSEVQRNVIAERGLRLPRG